MSSFPTLAFAEIEPEELAIDHQTDVDPLSGAALVHIPLSLTSGRSDFTPRLALAYNSSSGNSPYGLGWSLSGLLTISVNTTKSLPSYDGKDSFIFSSSGELLPVLRYEVDRWQPWIEEQGEFWVHYYRGRTENSHIRVEQWVHKGTHRVHWRTRDIHNVLTIYGSDLSNLSRIFDPADPSRTYTWLPEVQYDPQGNAILFEYIAENRTQVDTSLSFEQARAGSSQSLSQRYLKCIRYGNTVPLKADVPVPGNNRWLFEVVFDYGDHDDTGLPTVVPDRSWSLRPDPFSTYRPGFEVRTYRLCRRILLFHHFDELGPAPVLIHTHLLEHNLHPAGSTLRAIHFTGYRHDPASGQVSQHSLPPLRFTYSAPSVAHTFQPAPTETLQNVPHGLSGSDYRWIDLFGEGLPGILMESEQAWYFKPNEGNGIFGQQQLVINRPAYRLGQCAFSDFDSDGNTNLVVLHGRQGGFYEYNRDTEMWDSFRPFFSLPHLEAAGTKAQWLDVNGDGRADLVLSDQQQFTWYPCLGKDGFGPAVSIQTRSATSSAPFIEDPSLHYFFADMNGDGLPDQVLIRNGHVEYWPQLGNGLFGNPILMEDSPLFAPDWEFDVSRILLVDLDGNGTADLLYVGSGEVRYWFNDAGNRLVEGGQIANLPYIDNLSTLRVLDFLGEGTPCLVWSSPLADRASPLHYLPLTNGVKPRLLLSTDNSMGMEVRLSYSSSTAHYLRDKHSGRPWRTKLPNHLIVVDKKEVLDHIAATRTLTCYEYHDGYFDGEEQVFRGFGLVDQYDAELRDGDETSPACLRTWFHLGKASSASLAEGYRADTDQFTLPPHSFEDIQALASGEYEDALRALSGLVIRQELFATTSDGQLAAHPFQLTQYSYRLRRLQPARGDLHACFTSYLSERLTYDYEQQPDDPRVSHDLVLDVDDFSNTLQDCSVSYARRQSIAATAQQRTLLGARTLRFANFESADRHEVGIPIEVQEFEISGLVPGPSGVFTRQQLLQALPPALVSPLAHHEDFSGAAVQARLLHWERFIYWNDGASAPLPLASAGVPALLHHQETACFASSFMSRFFANKVDANMVQNDGGYRQQDGYWWQPSDVHHFQPASGFFQLARLERPDGGLTTFMYDPAYHLALVSIQDALGNSIQGEIDYHLVAAYRITDPNGNIAEVLYDPLGVSIVSAAQGQVLAAGGNPEVYGYDLLTSYTLRSNATFADVLSNPASYLQNAAQFVYYELDAWATSATPPRSITLVREEFAHDGQGGGAPSSPAQVTISYFDGFQRVLQRKTLAEPGPAFQRDTQGTLVLDTQGRPVEGQSDPRWLVTGHTVYDRKQQPVRQYEPYYSSTAAFETEAVLAQFGAFHQFHYDPTGRLLREDLPNGTYSRTEYTSWQTRRFDANDTVLDSLYHSQRASLPDTDVEKKALLKAEAHANTPTVLHLDPRGLTTKQVDTAPDGKHRVTETVLDLQGNTIAVVDPRGLPAFRYRLDMRGRVFLSQSMDAGENWTLFDIYDRPVHLWDGRGVHQHRQFDRLDRPTTVFVDGALGLHQLTEQMIYGEDASVSQAELRNARGRLALHRDQAGTLTFLQYDFMGQVLRSERQFYQLPQHRQDYTTEPDWSDPTAVALEPTRYSTQNSFDALGRIRQQSLPDGTSRQFDYLRGGGLNRVLLSTSDGKMNSVVLFNGSSFNARGQRTRFLLGNNVEITYTLDRETFRTSGITARRLPRKPGEATRTLQDIAYTYDPVGNITSSVDTAQQPATAGPFLQGLNVSSDSDFTYDAFYQLTRATGRVHQALLEHDYRPNLSFPDAVKGTRHLSFNNGAAIERYTRTYDYDLSGNLQAIHHQGVTRTWDTQLWVSPTSNHSLPADDPDGNPTTNRESRFDSNGNCIFLPHLRSLDWNYRNSISRAVVIDRSTTGEPDDAEYYMYDGSGLRVRKVSERLVSGQVETTETLYLDGCEIKRISRGTQPLLERTTSHISDGVNRIALVHRWTRDTFARETDDITQPRIRYQLSNHLGSSQLELDEDAAVISYEEYFPYGGTAFIAGDQRGEVASKDYRFCGKERDDATGLYYFEYRYYASWIGRWLSPDPIGPEEDHNLYRYVFNNPVNLIDPDGLAPQRRSSGDQIQTRYIPFENLPQQYQTPEVRAHGISIGFTSDPVTSAKDYGSLQRLSTAARQYHNVTIVIYDPQFQQYYESARKSGLKKSSAQELANLLINFQELLPQGNETQTDQGATDGTGQDTTSSLGTGNQQPAGSEQGGDGTQGQVQGPNGEAADSKGISSSEDSSAASVHAGDGSSTQSTPPTGGLGNEGTGPGAGIAGTARGAGDADNNQPGTVADAPETEQATDSSNSSATLLPGDNTVTDGNGVPGGTATETSITNVNLLPSTGTILAPPGQTMNGDDPNGSMAGSLSGIRGGRGDGRGDGMGSQGGTLSGQSAGPARGRPDQHPDWMDRLTGIAGYANFVFKQDHPEQAESGGVPGGTGTQNWGKLGQSLYIGFTIAQYLGSALKTVFQGLKAGLRGAATLIGRLFTREFWNGAAAFMGRLFTREFWSAAKTRFVRFFWDPRTFREISREYWDRYGPAAGRSLHHWLIPQRWTSIPQGLRNAGFNLLELPRVINFPGGLNSWMGFAQRWGGYRAVLAHVIENAIRFAIPASLFGGAYEGYQAGRYLSRNHPDTNPRTNPGQGVQHPASDLVAP